MNITTPTGIQVKANFLNDHHHILTRNSKLNAYNAFTRLVWNELQQYPGLTLRAEIINTVRLAIKVIQENLNHRGESSFNQFDYYGAINHAFFSHLTHGTSKKTLEIICCHRNMPAGSRKYSWFKTNYTSTAKDLRRWLDHPVSFEEQDNSSAVWYKSLMILSTTGSHELTTQQLNLPTDTRIPEMQPQEHHLISHILRNYGKINIQQFNGFKHYRNFVIRSSAEVIQQGYRPNESFTQPCATTLQAFKQLEFTAAEINSLKSLNGGIWDLFSQFQHIGYQLTASGQIVFSVMHPLVAYLIEDYNPLPDDKQQNGRLYQIHLERHARYVANQPAIDKVLAKIFEHYHTLYLGNKKDHNYSSNYLLNLEEDSANEVD